MPHCRIICLRRDKEEWVSRLILEMWQNVFAVSCLIQHSKPKSLLNKEFIFITSWFWKKFFCTVLSFSKKLWSLKCFDWSSFLWSFCYSVSFCSAFLQVLSHSFRFFFSFTFYVLFLYFILYFLIFFYFNLNFFIFSAGFNSIFTMVLYS